MQTHDLIQGIVEVVFLASHELQQHFNKFGWPFALPSLF